MGDDDTVKESLVESHETLDRLDRYYSSSNGSTSSVRCSPVLNPRGRKANATIEWKTVQIRTGTQIQA